VSAGPRAGAGAGAPPAHLAEVAGRVEARLAAFLAAERGRWERVDPALGEPLALLTNLVLGGGKRLRPAFCHWGLVAAGGDPADPALDVVGAGAALEMLHGFALVHVSLARHHRAEGWSGDADRWGEGGAILVGDMALVYADVLLGDVPVAAWRVFHEVRAELNVGQYLDLTAAARRDTDLATARRIARYKTGTYTVERPLHLGAAIAGRLDDGAGALGLVAALSAFGLPLGEAFQLRDDLLGAFGDEEVTGKPVGDDFREGKATVLLALAVQRATAAQRTVLDRVGDPALDDADVAALREVLEATGAVAAVEDSIRELHRDACAALEAAPIAAAARQPLLELADHAAWRDR